MRQELLDELNRFGETDAEGFAEFFLLKWFCGFCGGFCEKRVVGCGFLMVSLWWKRGELWCVDGRLLGFENFPRILDLVLRIPILGMGGDRVVTAPVFP